MIQPSFFLQVGFKNEIGVILSTEMLTLNITGNTTCHFYLWYPYISVIKQKLWHQQLWHWTWYQLIQQTTYPSSRWQKNERAFICL